MIKKNILVTVKCTVYNHEPYLRQCLDGFVMQKTNFAFEVLVHDDASTDGSKAIIEEYAERYPNIIKPMYETVNQYQIGGFYRIIQLMNKYVQGKYIAICEGDDYWIDPLKLQKQVDYMEVHPKCGLVYTKINQLEQVTGKISMGWAHQATFEEIITHDNPISTPTVLIRRDVYDKFYSHVKVDFSWKMADYPLWLYISHLSEIKCLADVTTTYRLLVNSASQSRKINKMLAFTYCGYDISIFFINYFDRRELLPQVNQHFQNCLFKLSKEFNQNISWQILKFALRNHAVSMKLILKCFGYSFQIIRKYYS